MHKTPMKTTAAKADWIFNARNSENPGKTV